MRELNGVLAAGLRHPELKRHALLFDKLQIWRLIGPENERTEEFEAEIAFLKDRGIVEAVPLDVRELEEAGADAVAHLAGLDFCLNPPQRSVIVTLTAEAPIFRDFSNRAIAAKIREKIGSDALPICETDLPDSPTTLCDGLVMSEVLTVAAECMPLPDETCAWEAIIDFKTEMKKKRWTFRRFIHDLGKKKYNQGELVDEFEYLLDDYRGEMDRHKLQRSIGRWETYVIPALEAFENLRPSGFVKGFLSVKKRKLALLEAEAKQAGNPIAYVFEAQKRFGKPT
jgi:hypothetical protein